MSDLIINNNEKIENINKRLEELLAQYRLKHDELELAEEEWDIGETQEALALYTKEINILKKHLHDLKENN